MSTAWFSRMAWDRSKSTLPYVATTLRTRGTSPPPLRAPAPRDPSADRVEHDRAARVLVRQRGQGRRQLAGGGGGQGGVQALVHLVRGEVPLGECLLEALHGGVAFAVGDPRRPIR